MGRVGGGLKFHYGVKEQFPGPNEVYFIEDSDTGELRIRAKVHKQVKEIRSVDSTLLVANDGLIRLGNIEGGSYVSINPTTGTLSFVGDATTWEDLRVPGFTVKLAGSSDPSYDTFKNGTKAYAFSHTANKEVHFDMQLPHAWKQGSTLYPHVHFAPNANPGVASTVRWALEYTWANVDEVFGASTTLNMDGTVGTTDTSKHTMTASTTLAGTGKTISSVMVCRLYRDTSVAGNYADKAFLVAFDVHYEIDQLGSNQVTTK